MILYRIIFFVLFVSVACSSVPALAFIAAHQQEFPIIHLCQVFAR
jgi:hypothetical protein